MLRRKLGTACAVAGAVLLVAGAFLPWVRIGSVSRSSFAITGVLARLGLDGWKGGALRAWPFAPLVVAASVALLALGYRKISCTLGLGFGLLGLVAGLAVRTIPDQTQIGPIIGMIGGVLALVGNIVLLASGHERTDPTRKELPS
jgi:hypothetical protein